MSVTRFADEFFHELARGPITAGLQTEQDFEIKFVVPIASRVASKHQDILLYAHPFGIRNSCLPECAKLPPGGAGRVLGCPKCWASSKDWATVAAFGSRHTFDLVARDRDNTFAAELKLVTINGGRMPNGEIQRFLGQCSLAASKHNIVVGIFGHRGKLKDKWHADTETVRKSLGIKNIRIIFREVE